MLEIINSRFEELTNTGSVYNHTLKDQVFVSKNDQAKMQQFALSVVHLIKQLTGQSSHYYIECQRIMDNPNFQTGMKAEMLRKIYGILSSAKSEWDAGFLKEIDYIVAAETFDDFLDHARKYHKAGKKTESAVLASAVLEDTIKKICKKNNTGTSLTLDPSIDELVKAGVFTSVKAKKIKYIAGIRNKALHANWDEFDIKDVGESINCIEELIQNYL